MMLGMSTLTKILASFSTKKSALRSADELRAALAEIDMVVLEANVSNLERQRKELLLTGSDDDLAANDAAIVTANRQAERGQAAIERLKELIVEAEAREAAAALEQQASEAQQAHEAITKVYAEVDATVAKARSLLASAHGHADTLRRWNSRAERAGLHDRRIAYPDPVTVKARLVGAFR